MVANLPARDSLVREVELARPVASRAAGGVVSDRWAGDVGR